MALLRLEFDIDGDVYPELHAALLALASDASRAERLRQLAASGLVWEKIRIRGPAMVHGGPAEALAAATAASGPLNPAASARRARSPRSAPPASPPEPMPPDFIDLALDATPFHPPAAPGIPPATLRAPPVLMDVVEPEALLSRPLAAPPAPQPAPPTAPRPAAQPSGAAPLRRPAMVPAEPAASTHAPNSAPASMLSPPGLAPAGLPEPMAGAFPDPAMLPTVATLLALSDAEPAAMDAVVAVASHPPDPMPGIEQPTAEPPLEHKPTTRSRLQRMKERGLFKNG